MRWLLMGCVWWMGAEAHADLWVVCREKATGKPFQTQRGGRPGSCLADVLANPQYGWSASDVEELLITDAEHQTLLAAWQQAPANPDRTKREAAQAKRAQTIGKLRALGLTDDEAQALVNGR